MAGPYFNSLYSAVISRALGHPDFNLAIPIMIQDDLTVVAPMAISRHNATASLPPTSIRLPSTDTHVCPYLAATVHHLATALREDADLTLELSKLHLLHLATPTSPSLAHTLISAFPAGTTVNETFYKVGGLAVGSSAGIHFFLTSLAQRYSDLIARFTSIIGLDPHGSLLILLLNLRPSDNHNHHLRGHPPSETLPFAQALRHSALRAFSHIINLPIAAFYHHPYEDPPEPPPPGLTPASPATSFQLFLPASRQGLGLIDPATAAGPAFLAGYTDSLPILRSRPEFIPYLQSAPPPSSSDIPFVAQARDLFAAVVADPTFAAATVTSQATPRDRLPFAARIRDADGRPSFSHLHLGAQRHSQTLFLNIPHRFVAALLIDPESHLSTPLDRVRLRALSRPGATSAFQTHFIEWAFHLPPAYLRFGLRSLLGVPHNHDSDFTLAALTSCKCSSFRTHPLPIEHTVHAFHHLQCAKFNLTTHRHDALLAVLEAALKQLGFDTNLSKRQNSSSTFKKTSTDLTALSVSFRPPNLAFDLTVTVSEMPTYFKEASRNAHAIFGRIDSRKRKRHEFGMDERRLSLVPFGFNHRAGIGPDTTVDWYRLVFRDACKLTTTAGGDAHEIALLYNTTFVRYNLTMIRHNYLAAARLTDQKPDPTPRLPRQADRTATAPAVPSSSFAATLLPVAHCSLAPVDAPAPTNAQIYIPPGPSHPHGSICLLPVPPSEAHGASQPPPPTGPRHPQTPTPASSSTASPPANPPTATTPPRRP